MDAKKILERSKNIIISPKNEWFKIEAEQQTKQQVLFDYAVPYISVVGVILAVSGSIYHDVTYAIANAIITCMVQVLSIFIVSFIIYELQKNFKGTANRDKCYNVVAYSLTPYWIVSVVTAILPAFASIAPIALYAFYLFYVGLCIFIAVPDDKRISFNLVAILILFLTNNILSAAGYKILHTIISSGNISFY